MKSLIFVFLLVLALGFTFTGFIIGALDEALSGVGCTRDSIATYSPGYILGCQVFERRWAKEMAEKEQRAAKKRSK